MAGVADAIHETPDRAVRERLGVERLGVDIAILEVAVGLVERGELGGSVA